MSDEKKESRESTSHPGDVQQASLGDQATFAGGFQQRDTQQSLGDQPTFGDQSSGIDDAFDSHMEVVDLEARYKVEGVLGKGGMGEVLLALDTRLERKVAIKRILGNAARSKTAVNRFLTEAKSIAALNHPNIVQIYDYGRAKDGPFLIMEFVEGSSLLDLCRDGALPLEEAVEITCQLCDGLGKAHSAGIIHRDIKPANVLMTTDGVPKLTDFGLAKAEAADTGMTMAGAVLGTLDFMPPEQRRDAALTDARSDLWSLAATLYQMVTGEPPRVIDLDAVPKELRSMLAQALKTKKDDRYQTASEMRDALKASLQKTAPFSIQQSDLGAGECPKCHVPNDATRKFCRECAASLRTTCLQCAVEMPVWDKVCGECGGKQADLLSTLLKDLLLKKDRAEALRGELAFDAAIEIATELAAIEDDRMLQVKEWADEFAESTQAEHERQLTKAREHFTESKKHREAFDYGAAIKTIQAIPEPIRSKEIVAFLANLESNERELCELITDLQLKKVQAEELRRELAFDAAIEIAKDLAAIETELASIEDDRISQVKAWAKEFAESTRAEHRRELTKAREHFAESKKHREAFDYASAIHAIESIPKPMRLPEVQAFLTSLRSDQGECTELLRTIKSRINARSIEGLLPLVERALELRGDREDLRKLRSQLTERENKLNRERDEAFLLAEALFTEGKGVEAFQAIRVFEASRLNPQQADFRKRLKEIVSAEEELVSLVKEAKADGVIDDDEIIALYPKTVEYLGLNPKHGLILKMRDDLLNRLKTIPRTKLSELPSQILEKLPPEVTGLVENSIGMRLQLISPGKFLMGEDEESHPVTLTQPFYLGIYQVTQEQYERVMGKNPSSFKGPQNPVDSVSWEDAVSFCEKLSSLQVEREAGRVYRLPTEAEWEYACRAGSTTTYCFGDDESQLGDYAWYKGNSERTTHSVGKKQPNAWGLYDMHGNVFEWCQDWYREYPKEAVIDPKGPSFVGGVFRTFFADRVRRGGSWDFTAEICRSAFRSRSVPSFRDSNDGFRVACVRRQLDFPLATIKFPC